jgi:hypothetical protein
LAAGKIANLGHRRSDQAADHITIVGARCPRPISSEVSFLIPIKEFLAALLRINSSSFAWIAELSRFCEF